MKESADFLAKEKHKEALPADTVTRIRGILSAMGFDCEETWAEENEIGTYSLRLNLSGTAVGSNGKGTTREFARASAYAELLERIQNNKVVANSTMNNILRDKKSAFYLYPDERFYSAEALANEQNAFLELFFSTRAASEREGARAQILKSYQKLDYNIHRRKDEFLCLPYCSLRAGQTVPIPYTLANMFYGSNGMSAGNTREEALVQGMSEVVERYVQKRIFSDRPALPDIPEDYLRRFEDIYGMYCAIRESGKYRVLLKDASLGGRYPACLLVLLEHDTGWYGVKVGAHPDYRIALERLFTEATQGIQLGTFAHKARFDFLNDGVFTQINLQNSYKTGDAKYPCELFGSTPSYPFCEPRDFSGATNREMLRYMTALLSEGGRDILLRDVSYLGFPAYHIIVPGMSEMNLPAKNDFEADNTRFHTQKLLCRPNLITQENARYLVSVIGFYQHSLQSNSLKDFSGCQSAAHYPAAEYSLDMLYFKAMCQLYVQDYPAAQKTYGTLVHIARQNTYWYTMDDYYFAVQHYIDGMALFKDHGVVMGYLKNLYSDGLCAVLERNFSCPDEVLTRQYPVLEEGARSYDYQELLRLHESYNKEQQKRAIDQCASFADLFANGTRS